MTRSEPPVEASSEAPHQLTLRDALAVAAQAGHLGGDLGSHLRHALAHLAVVRNEDPDPSRITDIGSGGGVPGLALVALETAPGILLIERRTNRGELLAWLVSRLGSRSDCTVAVADAAEVSRQPRWQGRSDVVVARSFGPPALTAEHAAGFLRPGGLVVVSEPPPPSSVTRWPGLGLRRLGLSDEGPRSVNEFTFRVLRATGPTSPARRTAARRPLWS